ncbi:hypothetical protein M9Y10_023414 [Tritrichomonas musculus]|uniref:Uncharacterized protein n=1 Tax=Tritrichomonas musculus TaxID=1915356 RepID=A0ABR2KVP7_9EUKA
MYRAIPEVNRICAMAERGRSYKLHQQALARIKNRPATFKQSDSMNNCGAIPSYAGSTTNGDAKSNCTRSTSLLSKAQKEKQLQIYNENQKILKAIEYQSPTICRADFFEHELDHERQVSRMTGKPEIYGFPVTKESNKANLNKKNKSKKNKNFDPEIVRPMPKKFDIASFENAESKSSQSKKKPQKGGNKNNGSNGGQLDDILTNGANGLLNTPQDNANAQNKKQQKPKAQQNKQTKSKNDQSGPLEEAVSSAVNDLSKTPQTDDQEKDDKKEDEEKEDDDKEDDDTEDGEKKDENGDLEKIVGGGIDALAGGAK